MKRRECLTGLLAPVLMSALPAAWALSRNATEFAELEHSNLSPAQSRVFRAWMQKIVGDQISRGPNPRWQQHDCAGLVRFAVSEALSPHDARWLRANGFQGQVIPPDLNLTDGQQQLRHAWRLADGTRSAYASAIELVQGNARFIGKDCNLAQAGDLLFYDQGDAQHLMIWMGNFIAYHTGTETRTDPGLRAIGLRELMRWPDTRWQPTHDNPNFAGLYRLSFLTA